MHYGEVGVARHPIFFVLRYDSQQQFLQHSQRLRIHDVVGNRVTIDHPLFFPINHLDFERLAVAYTRTRYMQLTVAEHRLRQ